MAFSFIGGVIFPGHLGSSPGLVGFDLRNLLFSWKCFLDHCLQCSQISCLSILLYDIVHYICSLRKFNSHRDRSVH